MSIKVNNTVKVNVYNILSDGIEGPLRAGLRRAYKHAGTPPSSEEEERIIDAQENAVMAWLCEILDFGD